MNTSQEFEQATYWVNRHQDLKDDPRSVGNLAASKEQNEAGERALVETMGALAALVTPDMNRVLDLGCGYGRVTGAFLEHGLSYTGLDVSPVALERARKTWPKAEFRETDLLNWTPSEQYDLVCVLYVLVHFVDDARWEQFFRSAAKSVSPGGYLLIADWFPDDKRKRAMHYVARPFSDYAALIEDCGLRVDNEMWSRLFTDRPGDPVRAHFRFLKKLA